MTLLLSRRSMLAAIGANGVAGCRSLPLADARPNPPYWVARGPAGTAALFGQIPLPAAVGWRSPEIDRALARAGEVWLENPEFSKADGEALAAQEKARSRPTLAEFLPGPTLNRLHQALTSAGGRSTASDATAADEVFQILSAIGDQLAHADPGNLPERFFRARAKSRGLPIVTEWQSLREVATFIPPAPDPVRLQLIDMGIDELASVPHRQQEVAAWLTGDIRPFEVTARVNAANYPELVERMSTLRNGRFAARIAERLSRPGRIFVCVGMLHLVGRDSIPRILSKAGMAVEFHGRT